MKIIIGNTTYTKIKNLSFAPESDLTGSTVPIEEYQADIITTDRIATGQYAELYDDADTLWAKYWVIDSYRVDANTMRVICQSVLVLLDRVTLQGDMFTGVTVQTMIDSIFGTVTSAYTVESSIASQTITGWCPKQTARERLQWVCFVAGAYVRTAFSGNVEIKPVGSTATLIPMSQIFWKPELEYGDKVTAVEITSFSFTQATPQPTDEYVTNGMEWYVVTRQAFRLDNPSATSADPENVVKVTDCMLVNSNNVGAVMTHLSKWFFNRVDMRADIINNAEFAPGQKVTAYADPETTVTGFIDTATFTFGLQARSTIHIKAVEVVDSAGLIINYMYGQTQVGMDRYTFPVGYLYNIENPYVDFTAGSNRYVFRPLTDYTSGTMPTGTKTETVNYDVALHQYGDTLHIVSVYDADQSEGTVTIA